MSNKFGKEKDSLLCLNEINFCFKLFSIISAVFVPSSFDPEELDKILNLFYYCDQYKEKEIIINKLFKSIKRIMKFKIKIKEGLPPLNILIIKAVLKVWGNSIKISLENKAFYCNAFVSLLSQIKVHQYSVVLEILQHPWINFLLPQKLTIDADKTYSLERSILSPECECKFLQLISRLSDKEKDNLIGILNKQTIDSSGSLFKDMKIILSCSSMKVDSDEMLLDILLGKSSPSYSLSFSSEELKQYLERLLDLFLRNRSKFQILLEGCLLELFCFDNLHKDFLETSNKHLNILQKCLQYENEEFFQKYIKLSFRQMSLMDTTNLKNNPIKMYLSKLKKEILNRHLDRHSIEARFAFLVGEALSNELDPKSEYFQKNKESKRFRKVLDFFAMLFQVFSCSPPVVQFFATEFLLYTYQNPVIYSKCISKVSELIIQWMNPNFTDNFVLDTFFNSTFDLFPFIKNPPLLIIKKIESAEIFLQILTRCKNQKLFYSQLSKFLTATKGSFTNWCQISERAFAELATMAVLKREKKEIVFELLEYLYEALLYSPTKRKMFEFVRLVERFDISNAIDVTYVKQILIQTQKFGILQPELHWFGFNGWPEEGIRLAPICLPSGFGVFFIFRLERKDQAQNEDLSSQCLLHFSNSNGNSLLEICIIKYQLYYRVMNKGKNAEIVLSDSIMEDTNYFLELYHISKKVSYRLNKKSLRIYRLSSFL